MPIPLPDPAMADIQVIKANGDVEPFSWEKLYNSLMRAHVSPQTCKQVGQHLSQTLPSTCTTADIRQAVEKYLNKKDRYSASRYTLKQAIMKLGPSGYPFERYVAHILKELGYKTKVSTIVQGKCTSHEVDVMAIKNRSTHMLECKYHNRRGIRSDVKVAMYVWARFQDIKEAWLTKLTNSIDFSQGWLVTNTKLTSDALEYSICRGLKVISWGYPEDGNLHQLISQTRTYPITSLRSLDRHTLQELLQHDIVTCKQVAQLDLNQFPQLKRHKLIAAQQEARLICAQSE